MSQTKTVAILIGLMFLATISLVAQKKTPVILITDLYLPAQDVGDNFDILTPYALPEIDLKGVILDVTNSFRRNDSIDGDAREPGFVAIHQLNYIFNKNVPTACSPFFAMRSAHDKMTDLPKFQQQGLELFFGILKSSNEKVEVVSTGSARLLAVAYNRNPGLMKKKIKNIHLCAGASSDHFMEWNIKLDTLAAYRLLSSDLPVCIYPCATESGPFDKGVNNTFWALNDLSFILDMEAPLQRYLAFAFLHKNRLDYLNYLDKPLSEKDRKELLDYEIGKWFGSGGKHYVWETAVWQIVAHRKLIKQKNGEIALLPEKEIEPGSTLCEEGLRPCVITPFEGGLFAFRYTRQQSNFKIYYRANPKQNELWLQQALPRLYKSFQTSKKEDHIH